MEFQHFTHSFLQLINNIFPHFIMVVISSHPIALDLLPHHFESSTPLQGWGKLIKLFVSLLIASLIIVPY